MTGTGDEIRFGLLGSLEVTAGGQPVSLPGRRVRALLALLVLRANQAVSTERIIRGLWGREPPKAARESVHYFVHQLRKLLPHAEGDRQGMLERHGGGYLLRVPPEAIDVVRFQRLIVQAGVARDGGDREAAWELYAEALGLWRGPVLDGLAEVPFAEAEISRLTEVRLVALEHQFRVGLELGLHDRLISELDAQVRGAPDREELRWLLMLALYRSHRQAEALQVYQDGRARLAGRGEPGLRLQRLQRAILIQDPSLDLHPIDQAVPSGLSKAVVRSDLSSPPAAAAASAHPASATPTPPADAAAQPAGWSGRREDDAPSLDERKLVTALVVGIVVDPDPPGGDPEEVRAQTRGTMERMAQRIRHYGGVVQTTDLGRLLATFGADYSHDDDPERGVRAALEVVASTDADDRPGLAVRGGVATGEAVVTHTQDGPDQVVGDVVHLAVTLEQNAQPGAVLVNAAIHQATSRVLTYTQVLPSGSLELASGTLLWQALEPRARTGASAHHGSDTPLLEREHELGILQDLLVRFLRDRHPQFLTLISEPGLGKSRLVAELGHLVDQAPELVGWRVGRTRAYGQGALGALVEVVKAEAGVLDDDDGPTIVRKLHEAVAGLFGKETARVAESLAHLLGAKETERPQQVLFEDWAEFLAAVADRRPLVLVLEDLQWADDALLEFTNGLVSRVGPVPLLLVCTGRPEFLDRWVGWGGGLRNALTITLSPLSRQGTRGLLDALLAHDQEPLPERTLEALVTSSGGNPLYVEEYVRMLAGQAPDAGVDAEDLAIPTSVQQVIATRIDTLPAPDKRLLQDAAVIGQTGWVGALAAVSQRDRAEVHAGLRRLERYGFLRRARVASVAGETEYAFRHTRICEVAYQQLLRADRATKHRRMAAWVQALTPDPGGRAETLAHHYSRALELTRATGQPAEELAEQARLAIRAAGDRVGSLGALTAAARLYERALALWPPNAPDRAALLLRYGEALAYGQHTGAEVLQAARAAFEATGDLGQAAEADVVLAQLARIHGDRAAAASHLERALALGPASSPAVASAVGAHAVELLLMEAYPKAVEVGQVAIHLGERLDLGSVQGLGWHAVGAARLHLGDADGLKELQDSVTMLAAVQHPTVDFARFGLPLFAYWFGDLKQCAELLAEQRSIVHDSSLVFSWFAIIQAALDYAAGRWDAASNLIDHYLASRGEEPGNHEPFCLAVRGWIRLGRGDLPGALDDAQTASARAETTQSRRYQHVAAALRGRVLLAIGDRDAATACLEELLADQRAHPAESHATLDQAALLLDLGYPPDTLPAALPPTPRHLAAQALAKGDLAGAIDRLGAIGAPVDQAAARVRHARARAAEGDIRAAGEQLKAAIGVYRAADAGRYLQEAEKVAALLPTGGQAG